MLNTRVPIQPKMVNWAIERAGYTLDTFMEKYPKSDVFEWLEGDKKPTIKQFQDFAKKLHVPFGYLFLKKPPVEELPFPFFRTGKEPTKTIDLNVYDTVLSLKKRQEWLSEYLQEEEANKLSFVGKFNLETPYLEIVQDIRETLNTSENWAEQILSRTEALNYLEKKIEEAGIIVTFNGVVGNNTHRKIEVDTCRGFVLVDEYVPFLFINNSDAKAAQIFTLIHELAHVWLGESAGFDNKQLLPSQDPLEILCDKVAAEFLVPEKYLTEVWEEEQDFKKLSKHFKVSPIVVARRLLDLGKLGKQAFFKFYHRYIAGFKKKGGSGGNFYNTANKRISTRFAAYIDQAVNNNKLLYADAYRLTNMKGDTYHKFMKDLFYQEA